MKLKYVLCLAIALISFTAHAQEKIAPLPDPTTKDDYKIYQKLGHQDKAWNEWIKPGFESFDESNYATASIFLQKAYDKGCRDPMVLFRLGIYMESRGKIKEAASYLDEAAKGTKQRYPDHALNKAVNRHAGRALYKADKYDDAKPYLLEALKYEPDDFMLLLMAGQIERLQDKKTKARALFEKALAAKTPEGVKPNPKTTVLGELIILTFDLKDYEACQKYIDQALKLDPKHKVAKRYNSQLQRRRIREKELEIIKKITE